MRYIIIAIASAFVACENNKGTGSFSLSGQFSGSGNEMIYLDKLAGAQPEVVDSVELEDDGTFSFTGHRPSIGFYRIRQSQQNFAMLVLDSSNKVRVTGNITDLGNTYRVEGSEETSLFLEYNEIVRRRDMRLDSINAAAQSVMAPDKMDAAKMDSVAATFEGPFNAIHQEANARLEKKILANTDRFSSIMAVQSLEPEKYAHVYEALAKGLSEKFPAQPTVRMFGDYVNGILKTSVGREAPDFTLTSADNRQISLSDFRGKVVLVDFWASWCGPCRREMPNVVRAYRKFSPRGFEILGVSLDQDRGKWLEAIRNDNMSWPQVSDLQGWQSSAAQLYQVQAIPYTVLVDTNGVILAKNLRGAELENKLAEVLEGRRETTVN